MLKSLLFVSALSLASVAAQASAADVYKLDPMHTSVTFQYAHGGGLSHPSGKFTNAAGTLTLDSVSPATGSVEVTFAIDTLSTGIAALDAELKGPGFFDAAKFPSATFKSTQVSVTGDNAARVTGDLTIHGVTKPVVLAVKLNKITDDRKKVGFSATASIKRSDFGISKYVPMVSDEVELTIETEASVVAP